VESHGGRIGTRPNPSGGSIFHFTRPGVKKEELTDAI
jgi:hypothetical protein